MDMFDEEDMRLAGWVHVTKESVREVKKYWVELIRPGIVRVHHPDGARTQDAGQAWLLDFREEAGKARPPQRKPRPPQKLQRQRRAAGERQVFLAPEELQGAGSNAPQGMWMLWCVLMMLVLVSAWAFAATVKPLLHYVRHTAFYVPAAVCAVAVWSATVALAWLGGTKLGHAVADKIYNPPAARRVRGEARPRRRTAPRRATRCMPMVGEDHGELPWCIAAKVREQEGQDRTRQGRAGQGKAGQGRAGQGRAGQHRTGG